MQAIQQNVIPSFPTLRLKGNLETLMFLRPLHLVSTLPRHPLSYPHMIFQSRLLLEQFSMQSEAARLASRLDSGRMKMSVMSSLRIHLYLSSAHLPGARMQTKGKIPPMELALTIKV